MADERRKEMKKHFVTVLVSVMIIMLTIVTGVKSAVAEYPEKPIYFTVPIGAGSGGDLFLRKMLGKVSEVLGQKIVVVNEGGAGGIPAYLKIYKAKPDGYTIGLGTVNIITHKIAGLFAYDYNDFTLLGTAYDSITPVLSSNKTKKPFKTIQEAVSFAKAHPDVVSIGISAKGQATWISAMAFIKAAGLKFNEVYHEGGGELMIPELAGGHLDLGVVSWSPILKEQIAAKNLNVLATISNLRLSGEFNSVPTLPEIGINAQRRGTGFIIGPPKIPENVKNKLVRAFEIGAKDPGYRKFMEEQNLPIDFYVSPSELPAVCDEQKVAITAIMKQAGIIK